MLFSLVLALTTVPTSTADKIELVCKKPLFATVYAEREKLSAEEVEEVFALLVGKREVAMDRLEMDSEDKESMKLICEIYDRGAGDNLAHTLTYFKKPIEEPTGGRTDVTWTESHR